MARDRPISVLVVEDERVVALDLEQSLLEFGYDVVGTAASANEAIALAARRCPDVVVMDIHLQGEIDGIDAATLLRERFAAAIVYLTAYSDDPTVERAKQSEPFGFLVKPVDLRELRSAIEIAHYRHALERQLREREHWFATTLRSIGDGVITTDASQRITFMNALAEVLTGARAEDARGRPMAEVVRLVDEATGTAIRDPIARAVALGRVVRLERPAMMIAGDGSERLIDDSAAPIVDDQGQVLGAVLVIRDVSDQRRLERQAELADRLATIGTMAAGVAHEINNPLQYILLATDRARISLAGLQGGEHGKEIASVQMLIEQIGQGVERASRIIADLNQIARSPAGRPGPADVVRAVEHAIASTRHELVSRARLETELAPVPAVEADEVRLVQVFVNLLVNASRAIEPGDADHNKVRVITRVDREGRVVVEVRDTGRGMSPDVLERAFDPFFTAGPERGTGLGLAICRGIVVAAGGTLTAESRPGVGTTFRVTLPAHVEPVAVTTPAAATPRTKQRGRILVVDDEPLLRSLFTELLGSDHDVVVAEHGAAALELVRAGAEFDVVVCDLAMPRLSGADLYEALLREQPALAHRMLFTSGGAVSVRFAEFLATVTNRVLSKPFHGEELLEAIQEVLHGKRA